VVTALANLKIAIRESGAVVTVDPLPTLNGDATQIERLLQNLIGNAVKYRLAGTKPAIHVAAVRKGDEWQFSVADNGIGIGEEHFDRVFDIFQRLHGREEYEGSGVGLAVCKQIIEHHGGRIWLESVPGEGSTFFFTLPDRFTAI
jgi:light-regulated signal transduction histidine kinase (bacteriophytochrome)